MNDVEAFTMFFSEMGIPIRSFKNEIDGGLDWMIELGPEREFAFYFSKGRYRGVGALTWNAPRGKGWCRGEGSGIEEE